MLDLLKILRDQKLNFIGDVVLLKPNELKKTFILFKYNKCCYNKNFKIYFLSIFILLLTGCYTNKPNENKINQRDEIIRLEKKIEKLEKLFITNFNSTSDVGEKIPDGPIKSVTIRMGTEDDRLRFYWADGQKSDLICTKESKSIWACG